jgi:hypothetical protein
MLGKVLAQLLPLLPILMLDFDPAKMAAGNKEDDAKVIRAAGETLSQPFFLEFSHMVYQRGLVLERIAHRLEGCECHRDIWISRGSHAQKERTLLRQTGFATCCWKGRQGAWFQAVGISELFSQLEGCTSDALQELMAAMPERQRAESGAAAGIAHRSYCRGAPG